MERGQILLEETRVEDEQLWHDDDAADREGWWCVRTDPFPCPAAGCTYVAEYMTAAHLILVWQEQDDPNLLKHAARVRVWFSLDATRIPALPLAGRDSQFRKVTVAFPQQGVKKLLASLANLELLG